MGVSGSKERKEKERKKNKENIENEENNEINIRYIKYKFQNEVKIFGEKFVKNNKNKSKIIYDNKEYELSE